MRDTSKEEYKRILGLDVLQALAVLMILFSKITYFIPFKGSIVAQFAPLLGFLGVELFLVLAGYWLGISLYKKCVLASHYTYENVQCFLKKLSIQYLPHYFIVLLVVFCISKGIGYSFGSIWPYFFFLQNFATPTPLFFVESWPLTVGFFAFLMLPMALWLALKIWTSVRKTMLYYTVVLSFILLSVGFKVLYFYSHGAVTVDQWNVGVKSVVLYRLDSVFIGVLFGSFSVGFSNYWKRYKYIGFGIGILLLLFLFVGIGYFGLMISDHPLLWEVWYLPLTSIALVFLIPIFSLWNSSARLWQYPFTYISSISYAVYLIHYSVIMQLFFYFWNNTFSNGRYLFCMFLLYCAITLVIGSLFHKFFEKLLLKFRVDN